MKIISLVALSLFLAACGAIQPKASTHATRIQKHGGATPIPWSSMRPTARRTVRLVEASFKNTHATVALVLKTRTDSPPHSLMYSVTLKGHFQNRHTLFDGVQFSVLGHEAWGFVSQHHPIKSIPNPMRFPTTP